MYAKASDCLTPKCYKGGQVTKPIILVKKCYKLLYVIQGVKLKVK